MEEKRNKKITKSTRRFSRFNQLCIPTNCFDCRSLEDGLPRTRLRPKPRMPDEGNNKQRQFLLFRRKCHIFCWVSLFSDQKSSYTQRLQISWEISIRSFDCRVWMCVIHFFLFGIQLAFKRNRLCLRQAKLHLPSVLFSVIFFKFTFCCLVCVTSSLEGPPTIRLVGGGVGGAVSISNDLHERECLRGCWANWDVRSVCWCVSVWCVSLECGCLLLGLSGVLEVEGLVVGPC